MKSKLEQGREKKSLKDNHRNLSENDSRQGKDLSLISKELLELNSISNVLCKKDLMF